MPLQRLIHNLSAFAAVIMMTVLTGCDDSSKSQGVGWHSQVPQGELPPGFDTFKERWNYRNRIWLEKQIASKSAELELRRKDYENATDESAKSSIENDIAEKEHSLKVFEQRLSEGDYIEYLTPQDIPDGLVWEDGMHNPEIGDPKAKKGGTFRMAQPGSYPSTFRLFGPNSNDSFRGRLYDEVEIGLVALHPVTRDVIPGLARQWAVAPDGRTVFFKLFDDATYSDGAKIRAIDFVVAMYVTTSEYSKSLIHKTYFQENMSHVRIYDDTTLSVTLPEPKPLTPFYAGAVFAVPPHFYCEFGPDFTEKYQWRVPPTTGAYTVDPDNVVRGRTVVMARVKDWWAKDKKFYRYRNNVDNIVYNFIGEDSKKLELLRIGELDIYPLTKPEDWYDKTEIAEVHNGYIERATFYTDFPRPPLGLYLNTAKDPLEDKNVRIGIHHAINVDKIIEVIFRGDCQRLGSYASGFGKFTDPTIKAREYSPEKARMYFAKAGYTVQGSDGILRKPDGTRLAIEVSFNNSPMLMAAMSILREEALKCGVDLRLDSLDATVFFRKVMEKRHQVALMAWMLTLPHPNLYQCFYSGYAYDDKGNVIPYTNNINSYSNPEMDRFLSEEKDARTEEQLVRACHAVQRLVHEDAIWVPGWATDFSRTGYWRWVKWPDSDTTKFCYPSLIDVEESYVYWIDEEVKEETLKAKREGKIFPEVDAVYDQYRLKTEASSDHE